MASIFPSMHIEKMSEITLDLRPLPKKEAYVELQAHIDNVLSGVEDTIAGMATISSLVHHAFGFLWTGFYRVTTQESPSPQLIVGPYQGTMGCLTIAFGRGVCGTAAADQKVVIVDDIEKFPGHISCDGRSRSEIVLPVWNREGELIAVFDVDSDKLATFGQEDADGLSNILNWFRT